MDRTFLIANGEDGVEALYADENIWLTQEMMGVLYDVETHTVNYHLKKIFTDSELQEKAVIRKFRITAGDGKTYNTKHYNFQDGLYQSDFDRIVKSADQADDHPEDERNE